MGQSQLTQSALSQIITDAVEALELGKVQIFGMRDSAHAALETVQSERERMAAHTAAPGPAGSAEQRLLQEARARLDGHLKEAQQMVARADALVTQVGVAMGFLAGSLHEVGNQLVDAQASRALGISVIKAQEEERRRVAREIHDGPAQLLANVVLRIDVCQKLFDADPSRARDELGQLKDLVRLSLQDVRKIIFDLRPMALDDLGLVPALRTYLKDYQSKTAIETDFAFFGQDRRFENAFEVAMFRLVQESLTNVAKHARASRVWVKVEVTATRDLRISVKDDGVGFDVVAVEKIAGTKFGLMGMKERVALLGGTMEIQSAPGAGTRLNFAFSITD